MDNNISMDRLYELYQKYMDKGKTEIAGALQREMQRQSPMYFSNGINDGMGEDVNQPYVMGQPVAPQPVMQQPQNVPPVQQAVNVPEQIANPINNPNASMGDFSILDSGIPSGNPADDSEQQGNGGNNTAQKIAQGLQAAANIASAVEGQPQQPMQQQLWGGNVTYQPYNIFDSFSNSIRGGVDAWRKRKADMLARAQQRR